MDDNQRVLRIIHGHREISKAFYGLLSKAAHRHGITPVQLVVLSKLAEHPNTRLSDLSERMNLGNSTMSGIIDRMVKADLVSRERTEADRRAITLSLTTKGAELRKATEVTKMQQLRPLLELSEHDQREWLRIQQDMIHILKDQQRKEDLHG